MTTARNEWFDVHKDGLNRLLQRDSKAFVLFELLQNALDTDARNIDVDLKSTSADEAELYFKDDSTHGFSDLSHAFTLFAPSEKMDDPEKRGRFNIGEKLVLALCNEAMIYTTKGIVHFKRNGGRELRGKDRLKRGTVVKGQLRFTREDVVDFIAAAQRVIVPRGKVFVVNGVEVLPKKVIAKFNASLPTIGANAKGEMIRTQRTTRVDVYNTDGPGWIYEMGIPVVESGDRFDVDVQQKVPLSMNRDNVPPGFLSKLRAHVLNHTAAILTEDEAADKWVGDALERPETEPATVSKVMTARFGPKRVIYDPSDPEANALATSKGYTVIPGRALSKAAWANVKEAGAAKPAGQVTPTPKPFSPHGDPLKIKANLSTGERAFEAFAAKMATILLGARIDLRVVFADDPGWKTTAAYRADRDRPTLFINARRVGKVFFDNFTVNGTPLSNERDPDREGIVQALDLLIHEFAHQIESNHLSENYHVACTKLGARLAWAVSRGLLPIPGT